MDIPQLQSNLIKDGAFRSDGYISPMWIKLKADHFDFQDTLGNTPQEKMYLIMKGNGEVPKCPICGKPARFYRYTDGYFKTCSNECKVILDRQNLAKLDPREAGKKAVESFYKKYGVKAPILVPSKKKQIEETCMKRYGVKNPGGLPFVQEKVKQTCLKKYGVDNPSKSPEILHKIFKKRGQTQPEKDFENLLKMSNFKYEKEYVLNGKSFDFAIFKGENLDSLVEIDGEYCHGILCDPDNININGLIDFLRFSKTGNNVKLFIGDSRKVKELFDWLKSNYKYSYNEWTNQIFRLFPNDFPYYNYSDERLEKDFKNLLTYENLNNKSRLADSIIFNFHKSIFNKKCVGRLSPIETWNNKDILRRCFNNKELYISPLSSRSILEGFRGSKIAPRTPVFSASLSKYILKEYAKDYEEIFDPYSEFSGKMLGACSLGKRYIGLNDDLNIIKESKEIINKFNLNADIFLSMDRYNFGCLFTRVPYLGIEEDAQYSCDDYIDLILKNYRCERYLIVVNNTERYKDKIVEKLKTNTFGKEIKEYLILI